MVADPSIRLRPLEREDLPFIHQLDNNASVMRYWFEEPYEAFVELTDLYDKHAAKAVLLVMDYAFTVLNLYKLYLVVDTENKKAIHVYKKLGFEVEGELKHEFFSNGEYRNALRMCTFQTDYLMKKKEQAAQWA